MINSGYFRIGTAVPLIVGITDSKLIFYHAMLRFNGYKTITTIDLNDRTVYG